MSRTRAAVALALILVLAGCGGIGGSGGDDVPSGATEIPLSEVEYPPHLDEDGVQEAAFWNNHSRMIERSFTSNYSYSTNDSHYYVSLKWDSERERLQYVRAIRENESSGYLAERVYVGDEQRHYVNETGWTNTTAVNTTEEAGRWQVEAIWPLTGKPRSANLTATRAYELDGTDYVAYRLSNYTRIDSYPDATGTFVVDERGIVHEWRVEYGSTVNTYDMSLRSVDLDEPAWVGTENQSEP